MKLRLLSAAVMLAAGLMVSAQTDPVDVTEQYLHNADFSEDAAITEGGICTYDYDMSKNGVSLFGMQTVTSWTASSPSDNTAQESRTDGANAKAAGIFAIGNEVAFLGGGGYTAPLSGPNDEEEGNVLGFIAVWGAKAQYTQEVTLPAGAYRMVITLQNRAGSTAVSANLCGFQAADGTNYYSSKLTWDMVTEWETDTIEFLLKEETNGAFSLGYTAGNAGSGAMPHLFFKSVELYTIDADPLIQAEIEAAKEDLLAAIEAGEELGISTSAAQAVYDDANATLEQVLAAIEAQKALNEKGLTDFTDFFINNAHFTNGEPLDGGVCTYDYDIETHQDKGAKYFGMQPVDSWTASNPNSNARASGVFAVGSPETIWLGGPGFATPEKKANGATEGNIFGFVSVWSASSYYYQQVTLPAGTYTITIPTYNCGGTGTVAKNLCGFISDDGEEYLAEKTSFELNKWTEETIKFTLYDETSGRISIGYQAANAGSGSMPHLWIDEFLLKYNGVLDIKPSLLALQAAVRTAEAYTDFSDGQYEEAIRAQLEDAYDAAQALVESTSEDDDANIAAATALNNLVIQARDSRDEYERFRNFIDGRLSAASEKYADNDEMADLAEELEDLIETYDEAYEDGSYSTEQIEAAISGLQAKIVAAVKVVLQQAVEAGGEQNVDVTALFTNTDWADNTITGWSNETGTSAFKSDNNTAEVWGQSSFNIYQTVADMPAGAYEITVQAFYRMGSNQVNYDESVTPQYETSKSYVYANENRKELRNVLQFAVADNARDEFHTGGIVNEQFDSIFVPNNMASAQHIFTTGDGSPNTLTAALLEAGDLTIGIQGVDLQGDEWTIWGEFTVVYRGEAGVDVALNDQIQQLIDEAQVYYAANCSGVIKATTDIEEATQAGEAAIESDATEAKLAAIKTLQSVIEYASKCAGLVEQITNELTLYDELISTVDIISNDTEFNALLEEVGTASDTEEFESNEIIEKWLADLKSGWSKYVLAQDGYAEASIDNPLDITPIILNSDFETGTLTGWNVESTNGDTGVKATDNDTYAMENSNGAYLFNTWNQGTVGYSIDQDIVLPTGFYTLKFVVATDADKVIVAHVGERTDSITCVGKAEGLEKSIDFSVTEAEQTVNIGLKGVETWYKADNFRLYYIGTTAPDAVIAIEDEEKASTLRNSATYNIAGQRVGKPQKGIYIIGNRKVVVK